MRRIRLLLRDWLLDGVAMHTHCEVRSEMQDAIKGAQDRLREHEARLGLMLSMQDTIKHVALDADARVDAMAEKLGLSIQIFDGRASVVGVSSEEFIANAKEYLLAVREMERVLDANARAIRGQTQMLALILRRQFGSKG